SLVAAIVLGRTVTRAAALAAAGRAPTLERLGLHSYRHLVLMVVVRIPRTAAARAATTPRAASAGGARRSGVRPETAVPLSGAAERRAASTAAARASSTASASRPVARCPAGSPLTAGAL